MIEAVHTYASPATIWVIVVLMSIVTAFLVAATSVADRVQSKASRRQHMMLHAERLDDNAPVGRDGAAAGLPSQRTPQETPSDQDGSRVQDEAGAPTEPTPAHGQGASGRHPMPAQRSGESDRAERSFAGPDNSGPDKAGQE